MSEIHSDIQWGESTPGLLIFLLDQSGSMYNKTTDVVKAIQDGVWPCLLDCEDGEDDLKRRFYLVVISYSGDGASIIKKSWSNEELYNLVKESRKTGTTFINPKAGGTTPMAEAFALAGDVVDEWINQTNVSKANGKLKGVPAPIVVNITDGEPDCASSAEQKAKELMSKKTDGGNVILLNLHLSDGKRDITKQFPVNEADLDNDDASQFLFRVSSLLDDKMVNIAYSKGLETARPGSRGLMVNAFGADINKFIAFGSGSGSASSTK